jgi:hypothetical protein
MKTFTTLLNYLGVFIVSYNCFSATQNNQKPKISDHHIDRLVEKGQFEKALNCIKIALPTCKKNKKRTYSLLSKKSRIHLFDDEIEQFIETADRAFKVYNKKNSIYQSLLCAQKSMYFHYFAHGDSTVIYADKALKLLHKNWASRNEIPVHFIYQVYATSHIYRPRKELNSVQNITAYLKNFEIYFDSALINFNCKPAYPQEKAMIYKSHANRVFDIVGYNIKRSKLDFLNYAVQQHYLNKPIDLYNKALACLPAEEYNYRYGIIALKALFYYCSNRENLGDNMLEPVVDRLYKDPVKMMASRLNNSLYAVQYFTHSIIHGNQYDPRIKKVQHIYEQILPIWEQRFSKVRNRKRDQYQNSPYSVLSLIDYWLFKRNKKSVDKESIVSRALQSYLYYSNHRIRTQTSDTKGNKSSSHATLFSVRSDNLFRLISIQKKLHNNEAILMKSPGNLGKELFVLVTKQHVFLDTDIRHPSKYNDLISCSDFKKFKRLAYQNFKSMPFAEILKSGKINKLYTVIELHENFDAMITDTLGDSFEKLSYFKQKINLVKIYNPIDFIHSFSTNSSIIARSRNGLLLNQKSNNTPYSSDLMNRLQFRYIDTVATEKLFQQVGTLHITGHNQAYDPSISTWETSTMHETFEQYLSKNNTLIFRDLIVLNSCFGSFKRMGFYPDRDFHHKLISIGTKAVIASPYETVDQSSAFIFEKFYKYLDKGETAEDALHHAKIDYLNNHKGSLAHPMYWSTYELTSNVKDLRLAPRTNRIFWEWIPVLIFLIGVSGSLIWDLVKKR